MRNSSVLLRCAKIFAANAVAPIFCPAGVDAAIARATPFVVVGRRLYTKLSGYTVIFFSLV
jgi:hypothetical protein